MRDGKRGEGEGGGVKCEEFLLATDKRFVTSAPSPDGLMFAPYYITFHELCSY